MDAEVEKLYESKYVKDNYIDFEKGIADIFYMDNSNLIKLDNETQLYLSDDSRKIDREKHTNVIAPVGFGNATKFDKKNSFK
ncbi:MAG: hypothetical protein JWQ09_278 [Segetibacter sp.]|nr:hypothetical protein [Segetibacter sp.]